MPVHIALLRAINVGGHKPVAMADLCDLLAHLGMRDVRSLLQTGNLVFRSDARKSGPLEQLLGAEAARRLDLHTDLFVRSASSATAGVSGGARFRGLWPRRVSDRPDIRGNRPHIVVGHVGPAPHRHRLPGPGLMRGNPALDLLDQPFIGAGAVKPDRSGERGALVGSPCILPMTRGAVGRAVEEPLAPCDGAVGDFGRARAR